MKLLPLLLLVLAHTTTAFADSYEFTASGADLGKLIVVKNCLDYHFCGGKGTSLAGGIPEYRFHTFIELSDVQLQTALTVCDFPKMDVNVSIQNLTKKTMAPISTFNADWYFRDDATTVNVIDRFTNEQLLNQYNKIKYLLAQKQYQLALDTVISEYNLPTSGYSMKIGKDIPTAGAITEHAKKTVTFTQASFGNACTLLQMARHELEHVAQYQKLLSCKAVGETHNFDDHISRERSAYLNDMRNVPVLCPEKAVSGPFVQFLQDTFFKSYSTAH